MGMKTNKPRSEQTVKAGPETPPPKSRAPLTKEQVPPILLEGDQSAHAHKSGPGQKYALGQDPLVETAKPETKTLPQAYGTRRLLLLARDPHSLYAHWDITRAQLNEYQAAAAGGQLAIRVLSLPTMTQVADVSLSPEAQDQFIKVPQAGATYVAELGYYGPQGEWVSVATSPPALTPPEKASEDRTVQFATVSPAPSASQTADQPTARGRRQLSLGTIAAYPPLTGVPPPKESGYQESVEQVSTEVQLSVPEEHEPWTTEQQAALAELTSGLPFAGNVSSPLGGMNVSSPFGAEQPPEGFWFNINAELVVYGATEVGARVTVGGRRINLRPDGTFSLRFALPEGDHTLDVSAHSSKDEWPHARLKFARHSEYHGEVGLHPQDPALTSPA
jgi:hypothetical protein